MAEALPELLLSRTAHIQIWKIGEEKQPVFVVDNAFANPELLLDFAERSEFRPPVQSSYYPGLNAHLPDNYLPTLASAIMGPLVELFGMPPTLRQHRFGFFGLTTQPPERMSARQALPHTDSANPNSFATVHFLNANFGGTAFYRHKATGFEVISNLHGYDYSKLRNKEVEAGKTSSECYEEIAYAEPLFNRLILYRATQLHSARIENQQNLTDNPSTGRLTANTFFNTV